MSENRQDDRENKYLAMSAAEFKLDEARFFLKKAAESTKSPREFRFFFDAALDAICGARDVAKEVASLDPLLRKVFERKIEQFNEEETSKLVLDNRVGAHHRSGRATLQPVIETGQTENGQAALHNMHLDDHVEYLVIIRPRLGPGEQTVTWTFLVRETRYKALDVCHVVVKELSELLAELRLKLGLGPDRGLKKFGLRFLKAMPELKSEV
jgi:hypothetical protein